MKHFNLKMLIFCCVGSVYFVGCGLWNEGEDCKKLQCSVHGTCLEGLCNCEDGYEGEKCDVLSNRKYIGHWKGKEVYHGGLPTDTLALEFTIVQVADSANTVKITNQNGKVIRMNGRVLSNYYFYTDKQVFLDSLRTLADATISMGKASDTIYYNANYKPIGGNSSFAGFGTLIKQ
jgi:hypothetical protein